MKKVAVKVLNTQVLGGRQLETFKREVWTLASFDHPNILKLLGVTLTPPFCIITELLKGSLESRMKYLTPTKRSIVVLQIALGMAQLHSKRVIHRDLKAANILMDEDDDSVARMIKFLTSKKVIIYSAGKISNKAEQIFASLSSYYKEEDQ